MKNLICNMAAMALAVVALTACQQGKFKVEGTVEGADSLTLYFENMALTGAVALDSVKLDAEGHFSFSGDKTEAPEFYRLRIDNQIINLAFDSTETVTITAHYPNMATRYEVEGSEECSVIRELSLKQIALQAQAIALERTPGMSRQRAQDSLLSLIAAYKQDVTTNYIFKAPNKAYAYFALFQAIGPWLIYDPKSNGDDVKVFAAVATSWDTYFPGAERGQNLHNITIEGMKNQRIMANQGVTVDASKVVEAGVIEIALPDQEGNIRRLTELKGKVVLLDFHMFAAPKSAERILLLRELYNKYHSRGLEIYQVALDEDEHFWKQTTAALPWICVRDAEGQSALHYNVKELPVFFTISRDNALQKRSSEISNINAEIESLL